MHAGIQRPRVCKIIRSTNFRKPTGMVRTATCIMSCAAWGTFLVTKRGITFGFWLSFGTMWLSFGSHLALIWLSFGFWHNIWLSFGNKRDQQAWEAFGAKRKSRPIIFAPATTPQPMAPYHLIVRFGHCLCPIQTSKGSIPKVEPEIEAREKSRLVWFAARGLGHHVRRPAPAGLPEGVWYYCHIICYRIIARSSCNITYVMF